jgi:hypothetical protein
MGTLYAMTFSSEPPKPPASGVGAIYIGEGIILGMDQNGGRYHGTYVQRGDRIMGNALLTFPQGGTLVTGLKMKPGWKVVLATNWPADLANAGQLELDVMQDMVQVSFEKIGDTQPQAVATSSGGPRVTAVKRSSAPKKTSTAGKKKSAAGKKKKARG